MCIKLSASGPSSNFRMFYNTYRGSLHVLRLMPAQRVCNQEPDEARAPRCDTPDWRINLLALGDIEAGIATLDCTGTARNSKP